MGLGLEQKKLLKARHEIGNKYGANEHFLGTGLTKDINSLDGIGIVETYSLDKKPAQLGELEQQGVLKRINLTSY